MGLKELQAWRLVRRRDVPDDRREHFSTPDDLMTIVRTLVEERKRREIDPTLSKLRELEIEGQDASDYASARITELRQLHRGTDQSLRGSRTDRDRKAADASKGGQHAVETRDRDGPRDPAARRQRHEGGQLT